MRRIVADNPATLTRYRKHSPDQFRDAITLVYGPLTVALAPFRATRIPGAFDEKGTGATSAFVLGGVDIPRIVRDPQLNVDVPTLQLADRLTDADGNTFEVTSPPFWSGGVVEANLELRG
jgi:hypothetical protein